MKYVSAIGVDVDALHLVAMYVAASVVTPVHHEAAFAAFMGLMGEDGAEQAGPDNQVVVHVCLVSYGLVFLFFLLLIHCDNLSITMIMMMYLTVLPTNMRVKVPKMGE